ncbi:unnamed protein product [Pipistrellus nathusii]|uniref:Uncharacterized protein n=1 Tax=Pipistrellus nathusii TaxID=59473 RepID=A0ABN9ZF82_PIPNA
MENPVTFDDFQRELEEYIRKQRARGLQPETRFRKETERDRTAPPGPPMLQPSLPFRGSPGFPGPHKRQRTVGSRLPQWANIHRSAPRLDSLLHRQKNHHFFQNPWLPSPPVRGGTPGPRAARGGDAARRPGVHQAGHLEPGPGRRSGEEGGGISLELQAKLRQRKRGAEGEACGEKGRRQEGEPGREEKPGRGKSGEQGVTKERSLSGRKKRPRGEGRPQQRGLWDLWDEAILGSCC